jgi:hypothetical protein
LADLTGQSDVTLSIANSLWAAQGYPFEDDYLTFVQDTFGATLDEVDLDSPQTADRIDAWADAWVDERTEGLIDAIGRGSRAARRERGARAAQRRVLPGYRPLAARFALAAGAAPLRASGSTRRAPKPPRSPVAS